MKGSFVFLVAFLAASVCGQAVPIFTADYYRVNPANYLDKEVTLAVAYVMPSDHSRADGTQELRANTYHQNRFGGHISIVASPEIAKRRCPAMRCPARLGSFPCHLDPWHFQKGRCEPGPLLRFCNQLSVDRASP